MNAADMLAQLIEPKHFPRIFRGVEIAVKKSFLTEQKRSMIYTFSANRITTNEVKRRTNFCYEMLKEVRGELGWSVFRICDALPEMLQRRIDGCEWRPVADEKNSHGRWLSAV